MSPRTRMTLAEVPAGCRVRIHNLGPQADVSFRLREMGFCENAIIRCVMKGNGNVICEISNTRIGLGNQIADTIMVSSE